MGVAEDRRGAFNEQFNAQLGNKLGRPRKNYTEASMVEALSNLNAKRSGSGGSSSSSKKEKAETAQIDVRDLLKNNEPKSDSVLESIWDTVSKPKELFEAAGSVFNKGIDLVSRLDYGVHSGLLEVQRSINAGEPFWSLGDDLAYGVTQGVTGKRKSGFGDVIEEGTNYQSEGKSFFNQLTGAIVGTPIGGGQVGEMMGKLEQTNPSLMDGGHLGNIPLPFTDASIPVAYPGVKDVAGIVGDVALSPSTYISAGSIVAARTAGKAGGKALAKEIGSEAVQRATKKIVKETLDISSVSTSTRRARTSTGTFGAGTVNRVDDVVDEVQKTLDKLFYDVAGGAQKGKNLSSLRETGATLAHTASTGFRDIALDEVDRSVKAFTKAYNSSKQWTKAQIDNEGIKNPLFKVWHDSYTASKVAGTADKKAMNDALETVGKSLDPETAEIFTKVHAALQAATTRIPTIRVLGRDVYQLPRLGKGLDKAGKVLRDSPLYNIQKAFSYASNFPGYSTFIAQRARSLGKLEFDNFRQEISRLARTTTEADRKILQTALENGTKLHGPLGVIQDTIRKHYDEMFNRESAAGFRKAADKTDNYAYVYLKGKENDLKTFTEGRTKQAKLVKNFDGFTSADAKALGLKPEEDAFNNLIMRKIKHNRKMTRSYFSNDLVNHYGIKVRHLTDVEATKRNLIAAEDLMDDAAKKALKPGEQIYLDRDIKNIYDKYAALSKVGSEEGAAVLKVIDYVTSKFKVGNTMYWPGFHIRNFLSDGYMGALDGVGIKDYRRIFKGMRTPGAQIDVGGHTMPFDELYETYKKNLSSGGFSATDIQKSVKRDLKGEGLVEQLTSPTSWPSAIKRGSEHREDFGRFAHFYHAMTEELPAAQKRFKKDFKQAYDAATNSALMRVNKYKFDYGALTSIEQRYMRRGMPFYTFMRKSIPTLLESIALSPKNLVMTNKIFNTMVPEGKDKWDAPMLPDYLGMSGYAELVGGPEPIGISGSMFPQDVFNGTFENPSASLNPMAKFLFEMQSGKDTFTGKKMENFADLFLNNFRGKAMYDKLMPGTSTFGNTSGVEKIGAALGVPIVKLTKEKQERVLTGKRYELVDKVREVDNQAKQRGYHVYLTEKNEIRVSQIDSEGKAITKPKVFTSLEEAQKFMGL